MADWFATPGYAFADKIDTSLTLAVWAKDMTGRYEKFVAGVKDSWNIAILHTADVDTNGKLAFRTASGNAMAGGYVLDDGNWHFLVGTYNYDAENPANSFQRLYVDGALAGEIASSAVLPLGAPAKMFSLAAGMNGMDETGNPDAWADVNGSFAELSVWNRALSAAEVGALYTRTARLGGAENGLVAYWPLTGAPGMACADYRFSNCSQTAGIPDLVSYFTNYNYTDRTAIEDDEGFPLPYVRYVASPEWCLDNSYVQAAGATGRSWSDPLTNLVETASAARKFERILCSPGTHGISASISPLVPYFTLGSADTATGEPCPKRAIIDAQGLCRHFISSEAATGESGFVVENLTFANGSADNGGSMLFQSRTGTIRNCTFRDNRATAGHGGAYYAWTANGTVLTNCVFSGNSASGGGGAAYTIQNAFSPDDFQRFADCEFTNNTASVGGAVCAERCVKLERCLFADNSATGAYGTGGHAKIGAHSLLDGCRFTGKCSADYGACVDLAGSGAVVTNSHFTGLVGEGATFGFIYVSADDVSFVNCAITDNANNDSIFFPLAHGGLLVRQCLVANNSDRRVIWGWDSSSRFENCTIADSGTAFGKTGANFATNVLVNCILTDMDVAGAGDFCNIVSNCLVSAAPGGLFDSGVVVDSNPRFADAAHGDFTLKRGSPCRERGLILDWMTAGSTDLAGNPRLVDANGQPFTASALPDIGCYEIQDKPVGFVLCLK